jgi:regulatory protein
VRLAEEGAHIMCPLLFVEAHHMIITAVEPAQNRRGRVEVYVDGVVAFDIARTTAMGRGLRPGGAIDAAQIDAIVAADRRRGALETAAMLARRPRSEREVRRRLAQRRFDSTLIDETVTRLRDLKLLDDAEFARAWTESRDRSSPRGRRLIVQELRAAGVALPTAIEAASGVLEEKAAYRVGVKRARALASCDYRAFRDKLGAHLQRRGFGWETARATVDRCWRELSGEAPAE